MSATAKPRTLPLSKRGLNFESVMWIFTRLTALGMYVLIIAGLIGALIVSQKTHSNLADILLWAFFPNASPNPLGGLIWITILTKLMVTAFVLVVSGHGVHGILEILDDYFATPFARRWFRNGMIAYALVVNVIAFYVIWKS
jgi:succinate dehydrogenase hydrophobic anchor subunit